MKKRKFESSEILKKSFQGLKVSDGLSLRKWSEIVNISSATLTLILNSKRLLPKKHLKKVADSFDYDRLAFENLTRAHSRDWLNLKGLDAQANTSKSYEDQDIVEIGENDVVLLRSWLHVALLEASTCHHFKDDPKLLAEQFQVSVGDIKIALFDLESSGFLVRVNGKLIKKSKKLRLPAKRSREIIRNFHVQMLKKAILHLQNSRDSESYEKRLITGYTVAVNPQHLEKAKLILEKAILEASSELIKGKATEVFQLQLQLFPLSKSHKK